LSTWFWKEGDEPLQESKHCPHVFVLLLDYILTSLVFTFWFYRFSHFYFIGFYLPPQISCSSIVSTQLRWSLSTSTLWKSLIGHTIQVQYKQAWSLFRCSHHSIDGRVGNEPNQLKNCSRLDSVINSLNLVHKPNESNLSSKLSSSNKWVELEISIVRLVWFMSQLDLYIYI